LYFEAEKLFIPATFILYFGQRRLEMSNDRPVISPAFRIASVAVFAAVTTVFTYIKIFFAPTRGYYNFGDVAITFCAITFGPLTALISGGIGTALADLLGGFPQWAPISLVVHGLEGLAIGLIVSLRRDNLLIQSLGGLVGMLLMIGGYFAAESTIMGMGLGPALAEVPVNIAQSGTGVILGIPLAFAVSRAYPPVKNWRW
jgi:uncharacterized membrane protein